MTAQDGHTHAYHEHSTYKMGLRVAAGSVARLHEKHTSRESSSDVVLWVVSAPFHGMTPMEGRAGYLGTSYPLFAG